MTHATAFRPPGTLPPVFELTWAQYAGRACCWCGTRLARGAVSAGIARGAQGAHILDVEVYACPGCARSTIRNPNGGIPLKPGDPDPPHD